MYKRQPLYPPFTFDAAAEALQALADRQVWGKAVVELDPGEAG